MSNLKTGKDARQKLIYGIKRAAQAVGSTMGTGGSNALIEVIEHPGHLATNDGATILSSIRFEDPLEEMGRKILVEAVSRANKQSGDGSSTTTVLTAAIIEAGAAYTGNIMELKRSLEACVPILEEALRKKSVEVTVDNVYDVATVSAEDETIGALIQQIYQQIGKDGIIHWDVSNTTEDHYTVGTGINIEDCGYLNPYLCDIDEKTGQFLNAIRWNNAPVLLVKQKISSVADVDSLFKKLFDAGETQVVVFCDEIEATVIPPLIQTRQVRGFKTMVVKMPTLWKDQWYEDLSKATGARIVDPQAGLPLKETTLEHLGRVGKIVVHKDNVFIDGIKDLTDHVAALEAENTDDSKLRAARLNTRTARLYLGAHSESALSYKRLKVEDAIAAAWQALHGGVVAGGGTALIEASRFLPDTPGGMLLKDALTAPAAQIAKNVGIESITPDVYRDNVGLDTRTKQYVNMVDAHVVNPTNVEINACKNAISVAAAILTASTVVTMPKHDETA
jgi:chaperonin GroEL